MSGGNSTSTGVVVRHGYLRKLKTMKRKYFVLRAETIDCSARLEYYESEKKFRAGATPRRVIPLKSCFNITRRLDLKQRHVIALYTSEEQFCVVAEGENDLHAWLTDILKQHQSEDTAEELLHPTQHVWQVNVQKKGLGASKNIIGLYNLCLTDKTLTLVKINPNNNITVDSSVPLRIDFYLRNIRRCGDSECFFYMEVGRQTMTGSGELWMHTDDANIAQSMHSTILHAMSNCKEEKEEIRNRSSSVNEDFRSTAQPRRQTYSTGQNRPNDKGLCVGSCIKNCVCMSSATYSIDDSGAAIAPLSPRNAVPNENQPPNTKITKIDQEHNPARVIKHHRTVSLPTGCPVLSDTLKIVHERTRSAPLTGDEVDRAVIEKATRHSSCKAVNGHDIILTKKSSHWCRRASTGTRLSKLSPAHTKNAPVIRNRCDSMPSRACPPIDTEKTMLRHLSDNVDGMDTSRDEIDASSEWHRTPRIPEESDYCDMTPRDVMNSSLSGTLPMRGEEYGYLPMTRGPDCSSSGSVCSGTPSTDPRFCDYPLEPATAMIGDDGVRCLRAYSVGSRPTQGPREARLDSRLRAYSVGARTRPVTRPSNSAPHLPRNSADDLMELDFTNNSPRTKVIVARTPPSAGFVQPPKYVSSRHDRSKLDEYVDMSPQTSSYVQMKPGSNLTLATSPPNKTIAALSKSPPKPVATTPEGYVQMDYGKRNEDKPPTIITSTPNRPVSIGHRIEPATSHSDDLIRRLFTKNITPTDSQTIFPLSPDSPRQEDKHELEVADVFEVELHALTTVKESSEDKSPEVGSPPHYVTIPRTYSQPIAAPAKLSDIDGEELSRNPTATKTWAGDNNVRNRLNKDRKSSSPAPSETQMSYAALDLETNTNTDSEELSRNQTKTRAGDNVKNRLNEDRKSSSPAPSENHQLNYAALDLEPKTTVSSTAPRAYTQIDFARSEKLNTADNC